METDTYTKQELAPETPFSADMLQERTLKYPDNPNDRNWILWTNLGTFTILSLSCSFGYRSVETAWCDTDNNFWIAQNCDVRESGAKTIAEAIQYVKDKS